MDCDGENSRHPAHELAEVQPVGKLNATISVTPTRSPRPYFGHGPPSSPGPADQRIPIHADSKVQAGIERWAFEQDTGAVCALSAAPSLLLAQLMTKEGSLHAPPHASDRPPCIWLPIGRSMPVPGGMAITGRSDTRPLTRPLRSDSHRQQPERAALRTLLRGGSAEGTVIVHDDNQPPQQGSVQSLSDILHNAYILVS